MARSGTRLLLWITAIGLVILIAMIVALVILVEDGPPSLASGPQWLHLKANGAIKEAPGAESLFADPNDLPPLTTELAAALRVAAVDDEVAGLFLEVEGLDLGWAQLQELRDAVGSFREAGKPCVVWAEALTNREYFLASACEEIDLAPAGFILVNGLSLTQVYYKEALDKLGINANFEHVGDFKSAVEPYLRTGPSEPAAEATNALLDSIYAQLVHAVAEGRGKTEEEALALVDDPPMTPQGAVDAGLVDALSYRDEVVEKMGEDRLSMSDYISDRRRDWGRGKDVVAVIYAEGAIISGSSDQDMFGSGYIGDRTLRRQLKEVREDEDVKAVVLRVNSPGGSGSASDSIWREVERTKAEKPVVVSMSDYAASGGYYISAGVNRIIAEPGTLTGSIGVFGGKMNLAGLMEKVGLQPFTFSRGANSGILSGTADFDESGREKFRSFLNSFYDIFLDRVAAGRSMSREAVHEVAQGRVWTGEQALERGLVDELGGLDVAIARATELASIKGEPEIRRIPERRGFFEQLMAEMERSGDPDALASLPGAKEALAPVVRLDRISAEGGAVLWMPLEVGF